MWARIPWHASFIMKLIEFAQFILLITSLDLILIILNYFVFLYFKKIELVRFSYYFFSCYKCKYIIFMIFLDFMKRTRSADAILTLNFFSILISDIPAICSTKSNCFQYTYGMSCLSWVIDMIQMRKCTVPNSKEW